VKNEARAPLKNTSFRRTHAPTRQLFNFFLEAIIAQGHPLIRGLADGFHYFRVQLTAEQFTISRGAFFYSIEGSLFISYTKKMGLLRHKPNAQDLVYMAKEFESGMFTPVVEKCFPLSKIVDVYNIMVKGM
jgi:hypothetical protein